MIALLAKIVAVITVFVLFLLGIGQAFAGIPPDAERYRRDLMRNARLVWGLDAPVATFAAQIHQESRYRFDAESPAGALGLAQFMPSTARWIAGAYPAELGTNEPLNPSWALRALVRYDRHLYERVRTFNTNCDRMAMTLASYNGGQGWVIKEQGIAATAGIDSGIWFGGVENYCVRAAWACRENRDYPRKILFHWQPLYIAGGWGLGVDCQGVAR